MKSNIKKSKISKKKNPQSAPQPLTLSYIIVEKFSRATTTTTTV